jgi:hypothetical protein
MAGRAPVIPKTTKTAAVLPLEEQIRQRAHALYLQHGGEDRTAMDDWLEAEREILSRQQEPKT